ncbi:MAG: response regulator [Planctomycetota bacterium]|jgi:DNA-binding NtrC family response regulator
MSMYRDLLLVDDDPAVRDMFRAVFDLWGYSYEVVSSAYDAIYIFDKIDDFKVIITDINMPGKDGMDLAQELISSGSAAALVAITGHVTEEVESCSSFIKVLPKPVDLMSLKGLIENFITSAASV